MNYLSGVRKGRLNEGPLLRVSILTKALRHSQGVQAVIFDVSSFDDLATGFHIHKEHQTRKTITLKGSLFSWKGARLDECH